MLPITYNRSSRVFDLSLLKSQITDFDNYEQGLTKVIGYPGYRAKDCVVKNSIGYVEWISTYQQYPSIKVEGLESNFILKEKFNQFDPIDIHLFVSQKSSYSFNWHTDSLNVFLYVVKGYKKLYLRNKIYDIFPGRGVLIPKGHLHRAFSRRDTWALSIGY